MRFRCNACMMKAPDRYACVFEGDRGDACPKCGASASPLVVELVDTHFVILDRAGPIQGLYRQRIACQPKRDHLGLHAVEQFAATDNPLEVTCPRCRGVKEWAEMMAALWPREHEVYRRAVEAGCCG